MRFKMYLDSNNYPFKSDIVIKVPSPIQILSYWYIDILHQFLIYDIDMDGCSIQSLPEFWITTSDNIHETFYSEYPS
jgi:hypothetical protein